MPLGSLTKTAMESGDYLLAGIKLIMTHQHCLALRNESAPTTRAGTPYLAYARDDKDKPGAKHGNEVGSGTGASVWSR